MKALYSLFLVVMTAVFLAGCGKAGQPARPAANATQPSVGLPALKQAVQNYKAQEGHYPNTLDDLVPKYIAKIPDAPGGYRYDYDSGTGEVKLTR